MPRYAIFSDVHGNGDALEAFIDHSRGQKAEVYLCLGDVVGYGAEPCFCLEKVRELCASGAAPGSDSVILLGNHDEAAASGEVLEMNRHAASALLWTRNQLSEEELEELASMPLTFELGDDLLLVHSSPCRPGDWNYVFNLRDMEVAFEHFSQKLCCIGHTHVPFVAQSIDGQLPVLLHEEKVKMNTAVAESAYLVNVGSVGQPRDRDPRGCYVIYDSDQGILERYRFEYDISSAQRKIRQAGLPDLLADRLALGF